MSDHHLPDEDEVRASVRRLVLDLAPHPAAATQRDDELVDDLGFHSLALVELALSLEEEFGLPRITQATARAILTVGAVEDHVLGQLAAARAQGVDS
jgi:acyl carrier protein